MRQVGHWVLGLCVLTFISSCGMASDEQRGNAAYRRAQKLEGGQKLVEQKMAYTMYQRAIDAHPDKISPQLRSRYIELSLLRAKQALNEGSVNSDAIVIHCRDVDKYLTKDAALPALNQDYALFLVQMADSFAVKEHFNLAMSFIEKAISYANDKTPFVTRRDELLKKVSKENIDLAQAEFDNGTQNTDDAEAFVRAEYYAVAALYFDSANAEAAKLLSTLRKKNVGTYSAYLRVIENIPDSAVFRKINKYDILLAVPSTKGSVYEITMYNYSFNPLKMKSEHFFAADKDGKRYKAAAAKIEPEMLDQEHEAKFKLSFPLPAGQAARLIYDNPPHYSEKCFF